MKKTLAIGILAFLFLSCRAQDATIIRGRITDSLSGEPLFGASLITGRNRGTISDIGGNYLLRTSRNKIQLTISYLGYRTVIRSLSTGGKDTLWLDIRLSRSATPLDEIVVSADRYEQRLSEVMVSVDIIKPGRITGNSTTSLETILRQTPGVEILDGQPSIRGGSGYAYGAGSRVLVLLDDLPILSGDVGDVKWDYLPVENISQVEIIKGASSVLYGSSALNGVINIRTRFPGNEPRTRISTFSGLYLNPRRKELVWWDRRPVFGGIDFSHSRKAGTIDLVLGGSLFRDQGYREEEYLDRARVNAGLKNRSKHLPGLSYGVHLNGMLLDKSDFLLWRDAGAGAWRQNPLSVSPLKGDRINVDPFLEYRGRKGDQHSLKSRVYHIRNNFTDTPDKNNQALQAYGEYRFLHRMGNRGKASVGLAGTWARSQAALYGDHSSWNQALYGQLDLSLLPSLNAAAGLRFERYVLDGQVEYSRPVVRMGLNYRALEHTYLRASFGQGYRFPSIAEKYTATNVGSLTIFPNPDLVSEKGYSAEIGAKQGLGTGAWRGYLDLAAFLTGYSNMIEFLFDDYLADSTGGGGLEDYGFMAQNTEKARIAGFEVSVYGHGLIGRIPIRFAAGYTCMDPLDVLATDTIPGRMTLKYRYRHSLRSDLELNPGRFTLGLACLFNSRMERVDEVFTDPLYGNLLLPGFPAYWEEKNRGQLVMDTRVLCNITPVFSVGLVIKNLLNLEYMGRPGDIQPPGNITLRLTAGF